MNKRACASHLWARLVAAAALAFVAVAIPASGEPATLVSAVGPSLDAHVSAVQPSADGRRVLLGGSTGLVSVDVAQAEVTAVAPSSTGLAGLAAWAQSPNGETVVWASSAHGSPMYEDRIGAPPVRLRLSSSFSPNGLGRGPDILEVHGMAVSATGQIYAFVHMVGAYADTNIASEGVLNATPGTPSWELVNDPFAATIQTAYTADTATSPTQNTFTTCTTLRRSDGPADNQEHDRFLLTVYEVVPTFRVTTASVQKVQPFNLASAAAAGCSAVDGGYGAFIMAVGPQFQAKTLVLVAGHGHTRQVALGRNQTFSGLSPNGRTVASADGDHLTLTNVASGRRRCSWSRAAVRQKDSWPGALTSAT